MIVWERGATVYDGGGARRELAEAITTLYTSLTGWWVAGERDFWKDEIIL